MLNRLQENILWSSKSNFMDIPTDCPQRDERMGWTGDIAVFSPVACYNFDMSRFLNKWMLDLKAEQLPTGGVPTRFRCRARLPGHHAGDGGGLVGRCLRAGTLERVQGPWRREILRKFYPGMKKIRPCLQILGGASQRGEAPVHLGFPRFVPLGDWVGSGRAENEPVAGPVQVDGHRQPEKLVRR